MKKLFLDLETTGVDLMKHGVHQIAYIIEIDGEVVKEGDCKVAPHPKAIMDPIALATCNVTENQIRGYQSMKEAHRKFTGLLSRYMNKYDRADKFHLVGFNNRSFDDRFLRLWFELNDDPFFGSWFWADSLDVLVLASQYLIDRRTSMPNFKLATVAKTLGVEVDKSRLHDALYDVTLTRAIYQIVTGLEIE